MKIAVLISGRAARYELCLLPLLQKNKYEFDLFISVNDTHSKYYENMERDLEPWLKGCYVKPYRLPEGFKNTHPKSLRQSIDGEFVPHNTMSMFFNDMNAFQMATKYADENGFEYDAYLKYRSDLIADDMPDIQKTVERKVFSVVPSCDFTEPLVNRETKTLGPEVPIVSDAVAYGNRDTMADYCDTYNFVLEINSDWDGDFPINFEQCVTEQVYDKGLPIERFNYPYKLDGNRRIFDTVWDKSGTSDCGDTRVNQIQGAHPPINSKDVESTNHIAPFPMT